MWISCVLHHLFGFSFALYWSATTSRTIENKFGWTTNLSCPDKGPNKMSGMDYWIC
jgi:hypothetical protein